MVIELELFYVILGIDLLHIVTGLWFLGSARLLPCRLRLRSSSSSQGVRLHILSICVFQFVPRTMRGKDRITLGSCIKIECSIMCQGDPSSAWLSRYVSCRTSRNASRAKRRIPQWPCSWACPFQEELKKQLDDLMSKDLFVVVSSWGAHVLLTEKKDRVGTCVTIIVLPPRW